MIQAHRFSSSLAKFSIKEIENICHLTQRDGFSIFFNQDLSPNEFVNLMKKIGTCETPNLFMNHKQFPEIFIVTGKKDENGQKVGMFGKGELDWHSNGNSRRYCDKILIALYCKIPDPNTTLSMCNTSLPFYSLTCEEQEYWKSIKIRLKFQNHKIYSLDETDSEFEFMSKQPGNIRNLVEKHPLTNKYYFYFPYGFIVKAWSNGKQINHSELIEELKPIVFQSQFQYHHIFQEGDLLLMDQLATLHRRTCASENRELWRIACDYSCVGSSITHAREI